MGVFKFLQQRRFEVVGIDFHFAGCDLLVGCAVKAELADAESFFGAHGRTESTTSDGPRSVEVTRTRRGVEDWAGFVVREICKTMFCIFVQHAASGVAGELGRDACDRLTRPCSNPRSSLLVLLPQFLKTVPQP